MGQQMSTDDQDEGFKNIICRMLQEADNEENQNSAEDGKIQNVTENSGSGDHKNKEDNKNKNDPDSKGSLQNESEKTENRECAERSAETNERNQKPQVTLKENKEICKNSGCTDDGGNQNNGNVKSEDMLSADKIKQEQNLSNDDNIGENQSEMKIGEKTDDLPNDVRIKKEIVSDETKNNGDDTMKNDKPKSLETMFLKDRIDSLINSCLSSKSSESDLDMNKSENISSSKTFDRSLSFQSIKREKNNTSRSQLSDPENGQKLPTSETSNASQEVQFSSLSTGNQRNGMIENLPESLKQKDDRVRETTTFQTLIEKVLDNSLSKTKKVESGQSLNGFRPIVDNRIPNKNQLNTIKNEMRNELLVKDKSESRSDNMSLNKSKVVYLKDHIEKVLEKTFQNSSRKDTEDVRTQDKSSARVDERYCQNKDPERVPIHRERSHSLVNEAIRPPIKERSNSFSMQGNNIELRRQKSFENYESNYLGPPKLIKVTEIYPDVGRDQGRYLQPPRIDTYDGDSRGSFKNSISPGGAYSRSSLDKSPVSPYYNHSPNSWHGQSPREQHVVHPNLSPNNTVPSPVYPSSRFPASPGNSYSNAGMLRYSDNNSHHMIPTSQMSGSRGFQQPYPQSSPLPSYPMTSFDGNTRHGYPKGNHEISPTSQHPGRHYPQSHFPVRHPVSTSAQTFYQNEPVGHSKYQTSPGHQYQQMSPRQLPYPSNRHPISPTTRSLAPYPTQNTQRTMIHPQQPYSTINDSNQNYPMERIHPLRQSQINPTGTPQGGSSRTSRAEFANRTMEGEHVIGNQQMAMGIHRSPHYTGEGNGRNPSVSSAMALGPMPPQHYFKHQSQKPPQLFPSSPPIPSVREFSINPAPSSAARQPLIPVGSRPDVRTQNVTEMPTRIPSNDTNNRTSGRFPAMHPPPVLDLSVPKDNSSMESDPDMQPLDLTCKSKSKASEIPRHTIGKGFSGFEYLVKNADKNTFEGNTNSYRREIPKPDNFQNSSPFSVETSAQFTTHNSQTHTANAGRNHSEMPVGTRGYSQNVHNQPQQTVSQQGGNAGYSQKPTMGLQIPVSPQTLTDGKETPTELGALGQGQALQAQDAQKAANVSRHEPIQNILGSHSPTDILYLICRLCGQTYGSPYGFRKHFRNQHGFEPRAEHTIVRTISETKTAMQSPPANSQAHTFAQKQNQANQISDIPENQFINQGQRSLPNTSHIDKSYKGQKEIISPSGFGKEEENSLESSELLQQKEDVESSGSRKCLECHECGQTFQLNDFGAYKRHCRQHGNSKINNPFDTNFTVDSSKNTSDRSFKDHSVDSFQTLNETSIGLQCKECCSTFSSQKYLNEHMKNQHSDLVQFSCLKCSNTFSDNISYQNHLTSAHIESMDVNEGTMNVKKRFIGSFQKSQMDGKQEETISSTIVTKNAADSMVTTASPDSSSDMIKKSSAVDSHLGSKTTNAETPTNKHSSESDSNMDVKSEVTSQNSCDSATPKIDDNGSSDGLYLHKKFGTKRKYITSVNSDVIENKIIRKDFKSTGSTRSPSVLSTNSCDDSESSVLPDEKPEVVESDQESNMSHSSSNVEGSDDTKITSVKTVGNKQEARHQLPFVWDRVTRSQVGRKPQKNN